jgi:hypothetical protein
VRPGVFTEMCSTCVFRPGNQMRLQPGRLKEIVDSNLETGTLLICHKTTYNQAPEEIACRGFFDRFGDQTNTKRVMDRLGGFREIEPPKPEE